MPAGLGVAVAIDMSRHEAIQRIVWVLLAHAETPAKAVVSATKERRHLGQRAQLDFRNLLRSAGLFARDDDSFFTRYSVPVTGISSVDEVRSVPEPTHFLSIPVPTEPRMRIAYNVFTGLLLKYIYKQYGAVPLQVVEGLAAVWVSEAGTPAASLPSNSNQLWPEFLESSIATEALRDGIESTFYGLKRGRPIGAIELPGIWKGKSIAQMLEAAAQKNGRAFQGQSKDRVKFTGTSKAALPTAPFSILSVQKEVRHSCTNMSFESHQRCLVCGRHGVMVQGGKFFLPENKKQSYEAPGPRDKFPKLCDACASIALLSGINSAPDISVIEFPADNFVELFAVYEQLQGLSATVALKTLSRAATLSVFPSRYLLLTIKPKPRTGATPMDTKTQVYVQLRHHAHLLAQVSQRTCRLYVKSEGFATSFGSEFYPHVAIGLSYFKRFPRWYETKGDQKMVAHRITKLLLEGRPFAGLYVAIQSQLLESDFVREQSVLVRGVIGFESDFITKKEFGTALARSLGGDGMKCDVYSDVIDFSNYLLSLSQPLVKREVRTSGSSVAGIARKFTELIARDFVECRAGNFLYVVCQRADQAEKRDAWWCKRDVFAALYPNAKTDSSIKQAQSGVDESQKAHESALKELKASEDVDREAKQRILREKEAELDEAFASVREAWDTFRGSNPKTELESRLVSLYEKYGADTAVWNKFLRETQARTLALLMLNVHRAS